MIQKISNNQPSFHGKLILSNFADNIVNERFRKMPSALRTKALEEYDQFIHKKICLHIRRTETILLPN